MRQSRMSSFLWKNFRPFKAGDKPVPANNNKIRALSCFDQGTVSCYEARKLILVPHGKLLKSIDLHDIPVGRCTQTRYLGQEKYISDVAQVNNLEKLQNNHFYLLIDWSIAPLIEVLLDSINYSLTELQIKVIMLRKKDRFLKFSNLNLNTETREATRQTNKREECQM